MDPAKMKVVDLRSELGALGLDTKGNKPALVDRLKKALEAKTGKVFPDTSVLDTSTEDLDETGTPRRPAARTTRRRSSYLASTPAKALRDELPEPIEEDLKEDSESSQPEPEPSNTPPPPSTFTPTTPKKRELFSQKESPTKPAEKEVFAIDDEEMLPEEVKEKEGRKEDMDVEKESTVEQIAGKENTEKKNGEEQIAEKTKADKEKPRYMTEEEEWEELNERLRIREKERIEREKKQAEEDAKKFEELSKDPLKLQRLKRKQEKKQRWSNYYRTIEVTNQVLAPPTEDLPTIEGKKDVVESKVVEPEINENRITLSWYDSDLNQYLEVPELNSVVPLSEGAFAYAWAGARASHGVTAGRVCYEVRMGSVLTTTESNEKDPITNGLRVGWSTVDSTLHLGDSETSWGYESSGRAVHNREFKEYGKPYVEKDVIGVYLDMESNPCKIFYTLNGVEQGTAYEFNKESLGGKPLFPHVLTKNMCYKVNMGYEKYNMLTKTKIVRQRIEVPVEQVLEEKRQRQEMIKAREAEIARLREEKKQKMRREREEKKRRKKEERCKQQEEGGAKDKNAGGEDADAEVKRDGDGEAEKPDESDGQGDDSGDNEEVKENGEKAPQEPPKEAEAMETDLPAEERVLKSEGSKVKQELQGKKVVQEEVTEEQVLQGVTLDNNIQYVIRNFVEYELDGVEACLEPGFVLIAHAELEPGPVRPESIEECEVILMVGMPCSGKTTWALKHAAENPHRRYNILSTGTLFDNMQVDCKPFRTLYEGRWDAMVSKGAKCVLKLLEIAKTRLRNYILDQTNVYPSAQRRKLREFEGRKRVAAVVVPSADEYRRRLEARPAAGKEVPDGAVLDMKANINLPEKCAWIDEVIFTELDREEADKLVDAFHKEAKAAGVTREREKRDRSASKDAPPAKRQRSIERRQQPRDDRRRDFGREREDRWGGSGGGGGGSRWGPAGRGGGGGGGGGRWAGGGRERGGGGGGMGGPPGRFDRGGGWQQQQNNREWGGGRDRDSFRGGRGGGGGGGRGPRDARPDGRGGGGGGGDGRGFSRDRARPPPHVQDKRQGPPPMPPHHGNNGGGGGGAGGAGSWQRGAAQGRPPRPGPPGGGGPPNRHNQKDAGPMQNQNQNPGGANQGPNNPGQNQGWNQWPGGWGSWGNWGNQNQGWGNWGNWGWGNPGQNAQMGQQQQPHVAQGQQAGAGGGKGGGAAVAAGGAAQWPANYTAQQWYQWQQWQQQQQGWPGYQQGSGQQGNPADQTQAWAQYYQNYGANAANAANPGGDKK